MIIFLDSCYEFLFFIKTTDYSITSILSKSVEITISPKEVTFDSLYGLDAQTRENMLKLLELFTLPDDMADIGDEEEDNEKEDVELIKIDGEEVHPDSKIIIENVKKHMDEHPNDYITAMKEIWVNMKYRAESWKAVDKTSEKYLKFIDEIPKALTYKSETSIIDYCLNTIDVAKSYINGQAANHEKLLLMAKYYEFEAAIYVTLCMMIINPGYIDEYYTDMELNLDWYFTYGKQYLQSEGNGICAVLSLRYVCGMLRCNLMDDKEYSNAFKANKPKGLEEDLHEEIIDEVDLFYAYAVLMKYKLYPDLDIEDVMFAFVNDWTSKENDMGLGTSADILSKIEFIETKERKNLPVKDIAASILKNYGDDPVLLKERRAFNFYRHLSERSGSKIYVPVKKTPTWRESIVVAVKSARDKVSYEFKNDPYYKCLHAVIFRRYIVGNRVKDTDNHTEFLLYLSYFHSILTLDKRKYMNHQNRAYSRLGHIGFYLNPVWFNISTADRIKEEIMSHPCIKATPFNLDSYDLENFIDKYIIFSDENLSASLRDIINNNIEHKEPISADDIYKHLLHTPLTDIYPDAKEITGSSDTERLYYIIGAMTSNPVFPESWNEGKYLTLFKLQHETNELLKTADVSKSSIPIFCGIFAIMNDKKQPETFEHGYVKELTNEGIIVYDPNLSFAKCSDASITDVYMPHAYKNYSFVTERIRFLGGNENKSLKIFALIFSIIMIMVLIGLIIYFVNKDSNETFFSIITHETV